MIEFQYSIESRTFHCMLDGRMDANTTEEVAKSVDERLEESGVDPAEDLKVVFDLEKVEYIASAFLRECLLIAKRFGKESFSVINSSPFVKKIFRESGCDKLFKVE